MSLRGRVAKLEAVRIGGQEIPNMRVVLLNEGDPEPTDIDAPDVIVVRFVRPQADAR
jgi:hypothetical protein